MKDVHVAVGVIVRAGQVLIARRPDHAHQGGLLEFPGGKVEPGETVQSALVREIAEETGLQIPPGSLRPVIEVYHDYGDKRVFLDVWRTDEARGDATGREGQTIGWVGVETLKDGDFPAANKAIIQALKLPSLLAITGDFETVDVGIRQLRLAVSRLPASECPGLMILRAPSMAAKDYRFMSESALAICEPAGVGLMLHGSPAMYDDNPRAAGLHLPWREAERIATRPVPDGALLGVSCHNVHQLDHAAALGADYVTLGPVKPTATHPDAQAMGWSQFGNLVSRAKVPVFGLGGLKIADLAQVQQAGGQGIAGIGYWWPRG